jgi:hypothetical protein
MVAFFIFLEGIQLQYNEKSQQCSFAPNRKFCPRGHSLVFTESAFDPSFHESDNLFYLSNPGTRLLDQISAFEDISGPVILDYAYFLMTFLSLLAANFCSF